MRVTAPWIRGSALAERIREMTELHTGLIGALKERSEHLEMAKDQLANWQTHWNTQFQASEKYRIEAEHWREMYERAVDGNRQEREKLVGHLVDLKREGFGVGMGTIVPSEPPTQMPEDVEAAIGRRSPDAVASRMNREYALEQLRLRPDAHAEIASEILAGGTIDAWGADDGD